MTTATASERALRMTHAEASELAQRVEAEGYRVRGLCAVPNRPWWEVSVAGQVTLAHPGDWNAQARRRAERARA